MTISPDHNKERALDLLRRGISPTMVAAALDVTPALISQFLADPDFAASLAEARSASLLKEQEQNDKILDIRGALVTRLDEAVTRGYIYKPMELLKAFQIIDSAKRATAALSGTPESAGAIVQITLPTFVSNKLTVNQITNQVVQIGEQDLTPLQVGALERFTQNETSALLPNSPTPSLENSSLKADISRNYDEDII